MSSIRRRVAAVALVTTLVAALATTTASAAPSPGGTLYLQQARGGTLIKKGSSWQLTLREPLTRTTAFTDRPERVGGSVSLTRFVSSWHKNFGTDAPNAALEIAGAPQSRNVVLLELSAPRYDASRRLLTFTAKPLKTSSDPALAALSRQADRGVHGGFGHASLFIDSGDEGSVVTFQFSGIPSAYVEIGLIETGDRFVYDPPASFTSATQGMRWMGAKTVLFLGCLAETCSGTATLSVDAPPTAPLTIQANLPTGGTVTASWAGGPVTTLPSGGGRLSLQPAHP
ncbi:MAG TPA: hypothetical protein VMH33_07075 [Solirubrobacterales bacterium]|nr:hypothetical protein [Solirubrobacterales bacterium]